MRRTYLSPILAVSAFFSGISLAAAQVFNGGLEEGVEVAGAIKGPAKTTDLVALVHMILNIVLGFLAFMATVVLIAAGLYLILGFGSDASKEKAKKVITYTIIGLLMVLFAEVIVQIVYYLAGQGAGVNPEPVVTELLAHVLSYLSLMATTVIIIAGIYLIVGFGSDASRDTAKKVVINTILGLLLILFAEAIVQTVILFAGGPGVTIDPRQIVTGVLRYVLSFLSLAAVITIVVAGLYLIFSNGNEEQKEKSKKIILYTILGLILILIARLIVSFFTQTVPANV